MRDPPKTGPLVYSLETERLMAGLSIYNREQRYGTDEETVELLGRIASLMNNSETEDPIFDIDDEDDADSADQGEGEE
jgi:hypothetical protein